ncbi:MAG: hypothetical protein H5U40_03835 [Polyangiaceae bacterium]|nr:hypothetical protein [Polyangiaceae bacterium]
MMRIGLMGPADGDEAAFRDAAEFLLGDVSVDRVVYLGQDGVAARVAEAWAREVAGETGLSFEDRAAALAIDGSPEAIASLLRADLQARRIGSICTVPRGPARAVEMVDDRIMLLVHDKSVLDEEDIANASLVVYGQSKELLLKRFGPRYFFTPGPLRAQKVGVIEREDDGRIAVAAFSPSGVPLFREVLAGKSVKLTVST